MKAILETHLYACHITFISLRQTAASLQSENFFKERKKKLKCLKRQLVLHWQQRTNLTAVPPPYFSESRLLLAIILGGKKSICDSCLLKSHRRTTEVTYRTKSLMLNPTGQRIQEMEFKCAFLGRWQQIVINTMLLFLNIDLPIPQMTNRANLLLHHFFKMYDVSPSFVFCFIPTVALNYDCTKDEHNLHPIRRDEG